MLNLYDRVSNTSVLHHARKASKIKKIVPWDNSRCPLPEFLDSILEEEAWIKIKIDQIAAQFVARMLNHKSPILLNFFRDRLYAVQLECTEVSDCVLATTFASIEQKSHNKYQYYYDIK